VYKSVLVALLSFGLLMASKSHAEPTSYFFNLDSVSRVICQADDGTHFMGTATVIGKDRILTAAHVVRNTKWCVYRGLGTKIISVDNNLDIAILESDTYSSPISPISCAGSKEELYLAFGYAEGHDYVVEPQIMTNIRKDFPAKDGGFPYDSPNLVVASGHIYEGMSGGPLVNAQGEIIATIVGVAGVDKQHLEVALFRDLKDTPLCNSEERIKMGLDEKIGR
jgi:hypothetical protein